MEAFLGVAPPEYAGPEDAQRRVRSSGILLRWLRGEFTACPPDADEQTVTFYCRGWVMNMFGSVLFPDATGDSASWMYLHCLQDWDDAGTYSWGSAVLAFLYRQLCEACRRVARTSSVGGCILLLQLWMWSRLPVGRPQVLQPRAWNFAHPDLRPTVAYLWDQVSPPYATNWRAYLDFQNELDALVPSTVRNSSLVQFVWGNSDKCTIDMTNIWVFISGGLGPLQHGRSRGPASQRSVSC